MDIKRLKGEWQGFLRMRVGKIRIVFRIDAESDELQVYDIDFRGNIYKSQQISEPPTVQETIEHLSQPLGEMAE
ncbi:hypothetical protein C7B76_16105 [filamentous cyanobacterium CCP2]|nr:hypothetical protein C7B76_16105 [filamentous cyanobacterium CCP2]